MSANIGQNTGINPTASESNQDNNLDTNMKQGIPLNNSRNAINCAHRTGSYDRELNNIDSRNFLRNSRGEIWSNDKLGKTGDPNEDHSTVQIGMARDSGESLAYAPARRSDQY